MNIFAIVITALSLASALFYLIGAIAASDDPDVVEDTNWITAEFKSFGFTTEIYFGLTAYSVDGGPNQRYDDSNCNADLCDECGEVGETTTAMVILALFCSFATTAVGAMSIMGKDSRMNSIVGIFASCLSILFGVIGFAVFDECYSKIDDDADSAEYGPGMALTLVAFLMMVVVAIMFVFQMIKGGGVRPV